MSAVEVNSTFVSSEPYHIQICNYMTQLQ